MADEVGLDLYNGRIEILRDRTLRPYNPARGADAPLTDAFREVESVAVIHRVHETSTRRCSTGRSTR
jgi:restriction endonuclease Mrr